MNKNKLKKIILIISVFVLAISVSYAFFAPLIGEGIANNANVISGTTDDLYFTEGDPLSITATQFNFTEGGENLSSETIVSANLRANSGDEEASSKYQIYLNVLENGYRYSTEDKSPEIILTITDPNGNELTTVDDLTYVTSDGVNGFDITEEGSIVQLVNDYEITSSSSSYYTVQDWTFKITYINLESDQEINEEKTFNAEILMQVEKAITPIMALYSELDESLDFYKFDKNAVEGTEYNGKIITKLYSGFEKEIFKSGSDVLWNEIKRDVSYINIIEEIVPLSTAYWFSGFMTSGTFDFTNLNTSQVVDMSHMFECFGSPYADFTLLGLENWDTSKVTNMSYMLTDMPDYGAYWDIVERNIGDISNWDTSNVTDMSSMFEFFGYYSDFVDIGDISNWDTSSVTNMSWMFYETNFTGFGDLGKWDVSNVIDMSSMFENFMYASNENIGDLSKWDVSKVTNMSCMFLAAGYYTTNWSVGDLDNWDVSNVTNMSGMFSYAGYVSETWNIGDISGWDVSNVTLMDLMFSGAGMEIENWSVGDLSNWDVSNVIYMNGMFNSAGMNSTTWYVGNISLWDTSKVENMSGMFSQSGLNASYTLDLSGWQVPLVTSYDEFNTSVESKITPPVWVN